MTALVASPQIRESIKQDIGTYSTILRIKPADFLPLVLDEPRYAVKFDELAKQVGSLAGKRMLEVGAGYGAMVVYGIATYHLDLWGLEPSKDAYEGRYEIAQQLLAENGIAAERIRQGVGEAMPFEDASFDVVYSFQVLEHVRDPFNVLVESWRVLKPGGVLFCQAPNYRTFYESHYNLPWPPGMPKWLAKWYLRLWGRNPVYLNHLNFLNEPQLLRWLTTICGAPPESDFGLAAWRDKLNHPRISPYTPAAITRWIRLAERLGLLHLMARLGGVWHWQEPLQFALRKTDAVGRAIAS